MESDAHTTEGAYIHTYMHTYIHTRIRHLLSTPALLLLFLLLFSPESRHNNRYRATGLSGQVYSYCFICTQSYLHTVHTLTQHLKGSVSYEALFHIFFIAGILEGGSVPR